MPSGRDVSGNSIGDEGVKALAQAFTANNGASKLNTTLRELNITNNLIKQEEGIKRIFPEPLMVLVETFAPTNLARDSTDFSPELDEPANISVVRKRRIPSFDTYLYEYANTKTSASTPMRPGQSVQGEEKPNKGPQQAGFRAGFCAFTESASQMNNNFCQLFSWPSSPEGSTVAPVASHSTE